MTSILPLPSVHHAPWQRGTLPTTTPLQHNLSTDVCIVGAGIAGLSCAYLLSRAGHHVTVLDAGPIAGGESSRTTAHLTNAVDDRYTEIERLHGARGAILVADSHTRAIDMIERIVQHEGIACDFTRLNGYLFAPAGESSDWLSSELDAARRAGVAVDMVERTPLRYHTGPALRFARQAQFEPLRYLAGLAACVLRDGGQIFSQTRVQTIHTAPATVHTESGYHVSAQHIIIATNTPINDVFVMHTKQAAYRTYAIAAQIAPDAVPRALYWDAPHHGPTPESYHYARLHTTDDGTLLIVGGEDHKTGQANDADLRFARLEQWMRRYFPTAGAVVQRWSGQVMEPVDGVAYIGRNPWDAPNVYIATGDSGMGMTHGTIAGILLTDLICRTDNAWESLYDPARKIIHATGRYLRENTNVIAQYRDWFTRGSVEHLEQIPPESGAIVRHHATKMAVYRDGHNHLHACSAVCPHLGGLVRWNATEKSWDCPCHGSRFDPFGVVLCGPATTNLTPTAPPDAETAPIPLPWSTL